MEKMLPSRTAPRLSTIGPRNRPADGDRFGPDHTAADRKHAHVDATKPAKDGCRWIGMTFKQWNAGPVILSVSEESSNEKILRCVQDDGAAFRLARKIRMTK